MKTSLHYSRLQTRLFVPCCQSGSSSSSCLHLDTHRNLWAHLIGVPGHLPFLMPLFWNLLGTVLASKPGKTPLPGLLSPVVLTSHTCPSAFTLTMSPLPQGPLGNYPQAPVSLIPYPVILSTWKRLHITDTQVIWRVDKSVCKSWKLLNRLFWEDGPDVQWGTVGTLGSVRSWFKY